MSIKKMLRWLFLCWALSANSSWAIELNEYPKVKAVADNLVASGHFSQAELNRIFTQAQIKQTVLDAMMNPAEYKFTWGKYRKLFLKPDRIEQGAEFWQENRVQLERAEKEYGVPAEIIVAIIGVESKFGKFKGKFRVLDSLVSLVTGFPRRSKFFAGELEEFLILSKENKLDATKILGSYAGAVGYPQFISSSYRNYAVDFNKDGRTDLINQVDDAIGSIANYFIRNGWQSGEPVTSKPRESVNVMIEELANRKRKVQYTAANLRAKGAVLADTIDDAEKLGVLMMDASEIVHNKKVSDTYIVRAGDTACQIAERQKVSCKKLFRLNKLNSRGDIFRGQMLKLPSSTKSKSAVKPVSKSKLLPKQKDSKWEVVITENGKGSVDVGANEAPEDGPQPIYFYTHRNFYAITQYNHSVLYAMAVYDLSEAIAKQYSKLKSEYK